jgi:hypothetical protein
MPTTAYPNMLTTRYAGSSRIRPDDTPDLNNALKAKFGPIGPTCMGPDPAYAITSTPATIFKHLYFIDKDLRIIRCIDTRRKDGQGCSVIGTPLPNWLDIDDIVSMAVTSGGTIFINRNSDAVVSILLGRFDLANTRTFGIFTTITPNVWNQHIWNSLPDAQGMPTTYKLIGNMALTPDGAFIVGAVSGGVIIPPLRFTPGPLNASNYPTFRSLTPGIIPKVVGGGLGRPLYYINGSDSIRGVTNIITWDSSEIVTIGSSKTFYSGELFSSVSVPNIDKMSLDLNTGNLWLESSGNLVVLAMSTNKLNGILTLEGGCIYTVQENLLINSNYIDGLARKGIAVNTSLCKNGPVRFTSDGDLLSPMSLDSTGLVCAWVMTVLPFPMIHQLDCGGADVLPSVTTYSPTHIQPSIAPPTTKGGSNGKQTLAFQIRNLLNKEGLFFLGLPRLLLTKTGVNRVTFSNFKIDSYNQGPDNALSGISYDSSGHILSVLPIQGAYSQSWRTTTESVIMVDINTDEPILSFKNDITPQTASITINPVLDFTGLMTPVFPALSNITQMVFADVNTLYVAEEKVVSRIDLNSGNRTLVAGNALSIEYYGNNAGDGFAAIDAKFNKIGGIAVYGNNLFISDSIDDVIRVVNLTTGIITAYIGAGYRSGGLFDQPEHMAIDSAGNLLVCNSRKNRIDRLINNSGTISITPVITGIAATGIAVDVFGNVYYNARSDPSRLVYRCDSSFANTAIAYGVGNGGIYVGKKYRDGITVTSTASLATYRFPTFVDPGTLPTKVLITGFSNASFNGVKTVVSQGFVSGSPIYTFTTSSGTATTILTGGAVEFPSKIAVADTVDYTVKTFDHDFTSGERGTVVAGRSGWRLYERTLFFGPTPNRSLSFYQPYCVAIDNYGNILIGDRIPGRDQITQANFTAAESDTRAIIPYQTIVTGYYLDRLGFTNANCHFVNSRLNTQGSQCLAVYNPYGSYPYRLLIDDSIDKRILSAPHLGFISTFQLAGLYDYSRSKFVNALNSLLENASGEFNGRMRAGLDSSGTKLRLTYMYGDGSTVMPGNNPGSNIASISLPSYQLSSSVLSITETIALNAGPTYDMVVDSNGQYLYTSDFTNNRIFRTDLNTNVQTIILENIRRPKGLAIDNIDEFLYIAESGSGQIIQCRLSSFEIRYLGAVFNDLHSIAVDNNELFILEKAAKRVLKMPVYNANNFSVTLMCLPREFTNPSSIVFVPGGTFLYLLDVNTIKRINRFTHEVSNIGLNIGLYYPSAFTIDAAGNVYITNTGLNCILKWNIGSGVTETVVKNHIGLTAIAYNNVTNKIYYGDNINREIRQVTIGPADPPVQVIPSGLGIISEMIKDSDGNIYAITNYNSVITRISANLKVITTYASDSSLFTSLKYLCMDSSKNIYVTNFNNNSVYRIAASGRAITTVTSDIPNPSGIAISLDGNILYVASSTMFEGPTLVAQWGIDQKFIKDGRIYKVNLTTAVKTVLVDNISGFPYGLSTLRMSQQGALYYTQMHPYRWSGTRSQPSGITNGIFTSTYILTSGGGSTITKCYPDSGQLEVALTLGGLEEVEWNVDSGPGRLDTIENMQGRRFRNFVINDTASKIFYLVDGTGSRRNSSMGRNDIRVFDRLVQRFPRDFNSSVFYNGVGRYQDETMPVIRSEVNGAGLLYDQGNNKVYKARDNIQIDFLPPTLGSIPTSNAFAGLYFGNKPNASQLMGVTALTDWQGDSQAALCVTSDMTPIDSGVAGPGRYKYEITAPYKLLPFLP